MAEIPKHPVYQKNILEFLTVANDYCLTLSSHEKLKKQDLIDYLTRVLPLLYIKASLIREIEVNNPDRNERYFTEEEWEALFNKLRNRFGRDDEFWFIERNNGNNESVKGSLAEHLTDIYQELKDFLLLYQKNSLDAKENSVSEVMKSFRERWGYGLVNAQKALHYLAMKHLPDTEEDDNGILF